MNAVEIVRAFHVLSEADRKAVLADTSKGLGKEIAGSEGAKAAIAHDYEASGAQKETAGLSPDERVAAMLPSHPFRQGASLPDGIKLDAAGLASEIPAAVPPLPSVSAVSFESLTGSQMPNADIASPISIKPVAKSGPLSADFPGHAALHEAGINTYGQLAKFAEDYTQIDGIGPATAESITEKLAE